MNISHQISIRGHDIAKKAYLHDNVFRWCRESHEKFSKDADHLVHYFYWSVDEERQK